MLRRKVSDEHNLLVTSLPPTSQQSWLAVAGAVALLMGFVIVAPFASRPLAPLSGFIPAIDATIFVTDLITTAMLLALFSISFSRALLTLACGYLFSSLIILAHALTFPGGFPPTQNLGGIQAPLRFYILWHLGYSMALVGYTLFNRDKLTTISSKTSPISVVSWSIAAVVFLVCFLVWISTTRAEFLPSLQLNSNRFSPLVAWLIPSTMLICAIPLAALWVCRRSLLDEWLMIVALASIIELALTALLGNAPFSVGFYTGRFFSIITSTVVLVLLLIETTKLYGRLAVANVMLERERDNKLISLEAVLASVDHELRQPLGAIAASCDAAILWLAKSPPELMKLRASLDRIALDRHRSTQVVGSLRALFRKPDQPLDFVDVNAVIVMVLDAVRGELAKQRITCCLNLTSKRAFVLGNENQLQQVLFNLFSNAIEAMQSTIDQLRNLTITTTVDGKDEITIEVEELWTWHRPESK